MMVLYSGTTDPYSHRCRFVLFEKGMDFEIRDVDIFAKPEDIAAHYGLARQWEQHDDVGCRCGPRLHGGKWMARLLHMAGRHRLAPWQGCPQEDDAGRLRL